MGDAGYTPNPETRRLIFGLYDKHVGSYFRIVVQRSEYFLIKNSLLCALSASAVSSLLRSVDEPVQFAGVLADNFVPHLRGQVTQFALDELARVGPHPVRVGKVRAPHDGIVP